MSLKYAIGDVIVVDDELWEIIRLDPECHHGQVYKVSALDKPGNTWVKESEVQSSKVPKDYIVCEKGILVENKNMMRFIEFPTVISLKEDNITDEYKAAWLKHFTGVSRECLLQNS